MDFKNNDRAIYLQIAEGVCDHILSGRWPEGERIPSVRDYAMTLMVNLNTVMHAYDHLSSRELIFNKRGLGYFVADGARARLRHERSEAFFNGEMQEFFHRMHLLGITPSEVAEHYQKFINEHN